MLPQGECRSLSGAFVLIKLQALTFCFPLVAPVPRPLLDNAPQASQSWVRVLYQGRSDGWVLTTNRRGPVLVPVEEDTADAAAGFDAQEALLAKSASSAPADASADDRPLTGAKASPANASQDPVVATEGEAGAGEERFMVALG